jgi:hypothetical protein
MTDILRFKTPTLEKRIELRGVISDMYRDKLTTLETEEELKISAPLITEMLWTLNGGQMKSEAFKWLEAGEVTLAEGKTFKMNKEARYVIIKKGYACDFVSVEDRERYTTEERAKGFSDYDTLAHLGCEVMLPELRDQLWAEYISGEKYNVKEL